ncbi:serine protease inhibitor swm-1-like isoform X2 [Diabrotica virgifera virgifera]|uniref:Uncharacterized protein n=1 Tax=Diabrotica virgifera virgifera TaxID=50390 RepID=A0ABM5IID3_DIAVI|nr:serine protease inhibitor swm-1-like isoform X2 [Diabrotica virgifera virgifera]
MKFVVFCFVLSAIVSLTVTIDCPANSTQVCGDCSPQESCSAPEPVALGGPYHCRLCQCRCDKGYLRDSGRCVLPKDCP